MIGNGNFGIYQRLTRRGPACWIGSTRTFRHGNFQASAHVTVEVRSDDNEGIVKADKTPRPGAGSATSWFKLNRKGRVLDTGSFHTGREFEGVCVNGNHFYAELAQRPELLRQRIK